MLLLKYVTELLQHIRELSICSILNSGILHMLNTYIRKEDRLFIYFFIKELKYFQEFSISISFYYYLGLCKRQKCNNQHYLPLDSLYI